jgi:hypothetical protein
LPAQLHSTAVADASLDQNEGSFSATNEHYQPDQRQHNGESQPHMRDGKEVEVHTWDGLDDPDNPYDIPKSAIVHCSDIYRFNWSLAYKWFLTVTVCFISILTGLPAGSYGAGNEYMASLFNVQNEPFPNLYWATCSWNIGAALFPLVFVPLTENTGRMPGYFVSGSARDRALLT